MAEGEPGDGGSRLTRRNPSLGLGGLKSEPRRARTTVKFIDSPTLFTIPNWRHAIGPVCFENSLIVRIGNRLEVSYPPNTGADARLGRKVAESLSRGLRSRPAWSNMEPCKGLGSSLSTGAGATATRRRAASVGPCSSSPKEKPPSCPKPSGSKARCCCEKSTPTTSRTPARKFIELPPTHNRARESAGDAPRQPLRPLPAGDLREVQAAAREKRRGDLWGSVRLPHVLQQQELQVCSGAARLAAGCRQ